MAFDPNSPTAAQKLSVSQPILQGNFQQLDTSFGIDHYKFSDSTSNNGFHNKVTTPEFVDNPATGLPPVTGANPVFYAFEDTVNLGVLQYSRGVNNAVPTPVTNIYSPEAPLSLTSGSSTPVLDFTGIYFAHCILIASETNTVLNYTNSVCWMIFFQNGKIPVVKAMTSSNTGFVEPIFSGNILDLVAPISTGACNNLFWTLNFQRIQT